MVNGINQPLWLRGHFWPVLAVLICLAWLASPAAVGQSANQQHSQDTVEHCRAIPDERLRLQCYENATSNSLSEPDRHTLLGGWRLIRTKNPADESEIISITQTADIFRSDDLAGLMLRCSGGDSLQVLFVLVRPLPPRAHPQVTLQAGSTDVSFAGSVLPPGLLIPLPAEASALVEGPWLSAPQLTVSLQDQESPIRGVIPLIGLGNGLRMLRSNCLTR